MTDLNDPLEHLHLEDQPPGYFTVRLLFWVGFIITIGNTGLGLLPHPSHLVLLIKGWPVFIAGAILYIPYFIWMHIAMRRLHRNMRKLDVEIESQTDQLIENLHDAQEKLKAAGL